MNLTSVIFFFSASLLLTAILLLSIRFQNSALRRSVKVLAAIIIFILTYNIIDYYGSPKPYTPDHNPTVYITETGDRYHDAGCGSLWNSSIAVTLCDAVISDYSMCARCTPPSYSTETISQILKSRESCIPPIDTFLFSWSYIVPGLILSLIIFVLLRFELYSKLKASGHPLVSEFTINAAVLLGLFYLPAVLIVFIAIYTFGSSILAIIGFFWQMIEPIYKRTAKRLCRHQISKRNSSNSPNTLSGSSIHSDQARIPSQAEEYYYMEAANGMTVRLPASRLEAWEAEQDRISRGEAPKLTAAEQDSIDRILNRIYGPKHPNTPKQ